MAFLLLIEELKSNDVETVVKAAGLLWDKAHDNYEIQVDVSNTNVTQRLLSYLQQFTNQYQLLKEKDEDLKDLKINIMKVTGALWIISRSLEQKKIIGNVTPIIFETGESSQVGNLTVVIQTLELFANVENDNSNNISWQIKNNIACILRNISSYAPLRDAIRENGGIIPLLKLLQCYHALFASNKSKNHNGCSKNHKLAALDTLGALAQIAANEKNKEVIAEFGGILIFIDLLEKNISTFSLADDPLYFDDIEVDLEMKLNSVIAIWNVAALNTKNKITIAENDGIQALLRVISSLIPIKSKSINEEDQSSSSSTSSARPKSRIRLEADLKEQTLGTLKSLSLHDKSLQLIIDNNGIAIIMKLFASYSHHLFASGNHDHCTFFTNVVGFIWNISVNRIAAKAVFDLDGFPLLINLLSSHCQSLSCNQSQIIPAKCKTQLIKNTINALKNFVAIDDTSNNYVRDMMTTTVNGNDIVKVLVSLIQEKPDDSLNDVISGDETLDARANCISILWNLMTNESNNIKIGESGVIKSLKLLLKNGSNIAKAKAAGALGSLATLARFRTEIGENDGIFSLIGLLKNVGENNNNLLEARICSAAALRNICAENEVNTKIMHENSDEIVTPLIDLLRTCNNVNNQNGKLLITGALWSISNKHPNTNNNNIHNEDITARQFIMAKKIFENDGILPLITVMKYGENREMKCESIWALENLLDVPLFVETMIERNTIPSLLNINIVPSQRIMLKIDVILLQRVIRSMRERCDGIVADNGDNDNDNNADNVDNDNMKKIERVRSRYLNTFYHIVCHMNSAPLLANRNDIEWRRPLSERDEEYIQSNEYIDFSDFRITNCDVDDANISDKLLLCVKDDDVDQLKNIIDQYKMSTSNNNNNNNNVSLDVIDKPSKISVMTRLELFEEDFDINTYEIKEGNTTTSEKSGERIKETILKFECTPLYAAVRLQRYECVKILLENGCDANWRPEFGFLRMFSVACLQGNMSILRLLLTFGCIFYFSFNPIPIDNEHPQPSHFNRISQNALILQQIALPGAIETPSTHTRTSKNMSNLNISAINISHPSWQTVTKIDFSNNQIKSPQ